MGTIGGQASGDFGLSQGALRIIYSLVKDTILDLSNDGYTQLNPSVVATVGAVSTVLPANVKRGVLGGSVAFTRPDVANGNHVGGAVAGVAGMRPLGLFINDALGNAYENTPGVASSKGPFLRGGAVGVKIYETAVQTVVPTHVAGANVAGVVGTALVYTEGDKLYASVNGLLTNRWADSCEAQWINTALSGSGYVTAANTVAIGTCDEPDVTCMGIVLSPPNVGASTEMFLTLAL